MNNRMNEILKRDFGRVDLLSIILTANDINTLEIDLNNKELKTIYNLVNKKIQEEINILSKTTNNNERFIRIKGIEFYENIKYTTLFNKNQLTTIYNLVDAALINGINLFNNTNDDRIKNVLKTSIDFFQNIKDKLIDQVAIGLQN